jgi:hypothetical protein
MHADTAWALKFQVCLGYTFTPATLGKMVYFSATLADSTTNRHLCNIDFLTARTVCLVSFFSTLNGCSKKNPWKIP